MSVSEGWAIKLHGELYLKRIRVAAMEYNYIVIKNYDNDAKIIQI